MKKVVILIVSALLLIAGVFFTMEYLKHKEQEEKFWKIQEARVTKYIHYNIKDVKSITFTKQDVSPMGVPKLKGYINKDENLWFIAHISTTEDFEDDFGCSGELYDNYVKKPKKSVSEIEKEEKKKIQE
ncbi:MULTISPECIES: DUF1433 domain-containing protein [Bacillus]|uniref:DUF1433 domain-containing protein n=1 Tax=Bacillus TaxID=1386 RepID=UPI00032FD2C4|nr:hypothetical protein ICS_02377 [Bacillus cereus BAG2O-3]EOQ10906.1 hypothetical protein KQ3_02510 [Bacillus cereus B5-2]EOQ28926.1 hypothetical protein KQ1_03177 [Bacillus cereus BAG3O-1]MBJ8117789.1 DUF1433 domain-containing protein [Bacillus cereus]PFW60174.1 DUF1433 domain-containing protein [Bacillus sp. AFS075960]RFB21004.1 DUF1433 domain-containing protein [Bacillus sp. LB(2018)]RFB46313.1 DUF1433 domain-containing protein [Bacillus sp. dmp10]